MKLTITKLLGGALLALFLVPVNALAEWRDIKVDLTEKKLVTEEESAAGYTWVNSGDYIGIAVDEKGVVSRVDKNAVNAVCQVKGKWHSDQWGWVNHEIIVPVEGTVKITLGDAYSYGSGVTVKNSSNESVVDGLSTYVEGKYYSSGHPENVVYAYYSGPATTLTITGGNYLLYFAIEEVAYVPDNKTVTFGVGTTGATGVVPDAQTKDINLVNQISIPTNRSLSISGKTLTGWSDGINIYDIGDTYTITDDVILTPVFVSNATTLNDRAAETTVTWDFQRNNGAPTINLSTGQTGIWVGHASIGGKTIDIKADFNTGTGKFANGNWGDWAQLVGSGAFTFTIPVVSGTVITIVSYNAMSASTIAGSTEYVCTGSTGLFTTTYTYIGASPTIDIVLSDGSYHRYISATYPAQPTRTITISDAKYATYYNSVAYQLPANLQAAIVDNETSGALSLNYLYGEGDVVPAGTPVLLKATAAGDYTLTMQPQDVTDAPSGNLLYGSDVATTTTGGGDGAKYYALQYGTGEKTSVLGFYWAAANGAAFTSGAHKAWLALPTATSARFFALDGEATAISDVRCLKADVKGDYFNLNGQRVAQPTKGLYIVNGKKVIIK